jgi:chromosome partitioning protein
MRTIAVLNQKGGTGKTTIAANLAAAAHLAGQRTLILDLDQQGSSLDWFSAREAGSRLDGLNVARTDKALSLPKFRTLSQGYDVVLCDGPPRIGDVTRAAAVAADVIVIPLRAGPLDWWAASETIELLDSADQIRAELRLPVTRRLFVLNGVASNTRITRLALDAIAPNGELAPITIGNRVAFAESMFTGESVLTFGAPASPAADEITRLYEAAMAEAA